MNIIELKDITKTYHTGAVDVRALNGVSLTIRQGEFVAIMGHSGSGKSTLLHLLGLLDKPTGGSYRLAGREVSTLSDDELAAVRNETIGFVFQQFNLLPRVSALANVGLPLIYAGKDRTGAAGIEAALLERVGLGHRTHHKPNELSGGQQQRVAIARALVNDPLIIFADEPTGNLDTKSSIEIMNLLTELHRSGITVVMVTHEPDIAEAASRIITVQDGAIVSDVTKTPAGDGGRAPAGPPRGHAGPFDAGRIREYFLQAFRALWGNRTRSVLSILGVLIGVTSLIAMMALGTGAQEQVKKNISSLGSNLLMVHASSPRRGGISMEGGASVQLSAKDAEEVKAQVPWVTHVAPYVSGRAQAVYGGNNWNTRVQGTTPDYFAVRNAPPARGRIFTDEETVTRAKVALIGKTVATQLFGDANPLGEFIRINRTDFRVIGILPEKGSTGWQDQDDQIIMPLNTVMYRLLGKDTIDSMDVQVAEASRMDETGERIQALIAELHRLPPSKAEEIDIRNMADIQETISATTKTFSYLLGSIAFISLLVGGIGIMNIMLVSVSERTREIGLRKAIGATNGDILAQFMIESVVICVTGGLAGILLGTGISLGLAQFAGWSTKVSAGSVTASFVFSVLTGLVFGVWPARKAARLNPIEALRYE